MGPVLMRDLSIGPKQLGFLVSAYTFAAAVVGLLSALIIDRFDRRSAMLFVTSLFVVAEILCALSPNYAVLFVCRMACGACSGVMTALAQTIIADVYPPQRRGAAIGQLMSAFAAASVAGVPIGLYFASEFGWHAPFVFIVVCVSLTLVAAHRFIPHLTEHVTQNKTPTNQTFTARLFGPLLAVVGYSQHLKAYGLMALVVASSFLVIPYISVYTVANVHLPAKQLSLVYLLGGIAALLASRFIGLGVDKLGPLTMFKLLSGLSIVSVFLTTHMVPAPIWLVLIVSTLFFIAVPSRMAPTMAMMAAVALPSMRGTFLSLNGALQSTMQGLAAFTAAMIISRNQAGEIEHFGIVGIVSIVLIIAGVLWAPKVSILVSVAPRVGDTPKS
jgi:predicted MFS family arabinose efflux permease